ncbi:MAG TPA: sensor domain-containing diguanylate cyclase [Gemmatimonadaceae bacterium]|nr:sensor domain-containing diguanylate cyclase [Gemmatimonadaceae bacterium]
MTPAPAAQAVPASGDQSNAEILRWQGKFRRVFALVVGFGTIALKWTGTISADSVVARSIGPHPALLLGSALVVAYLIFVELSLAVIRKRDSAGHDAPVIAAAADMAMLFGFVYIVTPPAEYARVLIVTFFPVQFTLLYFGSRTALYDLGCVAAFYLAIVLAASDHGMVPDATERMWDLVLYLIGALLFVFLQSHMARRLKRIVQVFERAQDGDFSAQYDESLDRIPDPITVVGRAYNKMRGHLETIVLTDPLSGCYNRRGFEQLATREVSRALRGGQPLSVLALDVDHFKRINDEYGHLTGDEVLREMGLLLRETARLGDVVARYGGEEFEILAPDTTHEGAKILADRIQHAFRTHPFTAVGVDRSVSVSIGIASDIARNDRIAAVLIARADEALYVAKRNGRDRSELWHPGMRAFDGSSPGRRSMEVSAVKMDE